ncbi:ribosomal protein S18 [Hypoxylon fragiforme]|uniref:ribosomal protein S18 n=1 Tax=Hypoxylon fragiforme TaxID=63214 RepID=UPI0020C6634F|nr:ribosomal protein S18 [Hypoxylon fragiforme]KAI2606414.1 ribosomal protein S18 [Hypoxylon fragiforme]
MPPRIPILTTLRNPSKLFRSQVANLSTTKPCLEIRRNVPSMTSQLLDMDSAPSSSPSPTSPPSFSRDRRDFNNRGDATQSAADIYDRLRQAQQPTILEEMQQSNQNEGYSRQMTRRWKVGDVYAPHDLSPAEMGKWRRNQARQKDRVDMLGLHPLDMYRNFSVISEFVTPHGRIKRSADTGLRPPNQRKVAKAIRRAIGLGLHPSVHRHPELLIRENTRIYAQNIATIKKDLKY